MLTFFQINGFPSFQFGLILLWENAKVEDNLIIYKRMDIIFLQVILIMEIIISLLA